MKEKRKKERKKGKGKAFLGSDFLNLNEWYKRLSLTPKQREDLLLAFLTIHTGYSHHPHINLSLAFSFHLSLSSNPSVGAKIKTLWWLFLESVVDMEGHPHHPQHHHHQQPLGVNVDTSDRFPQWSIQETKQFLMIRAELDRSFMETKRNKLLWEVVATKMKEKGYNRSAEQCKCKWKNLSTRFKACETMEAESTRQQFPFYNELQAIYGARMQRMLWTEAEGGASGSKKKAAQISSDDEEENEDSEAEKGSSRKKIKKGKSNTTGSSHINSLKEILDNFMKQQMQMELQWREAFEARENERKMKEMEWRRTMEALENERILMEQRWREREEQRRMREEARAEKRDALITALLNRLRREDI